MVKRRDIPINIDDGAPLPAYRWFNTLIVAKDTRFVYLGKQNLIIFNDSPLLNITNFILKSTLKRGPIRVQKKNVTNCHIPHINIDRFN